MNSYTFLKYIHLFTVIFTICGFIVRAALNFANSPILHHKIIKIAPHINDTLLLITGIWLSLKIEQYPITDNWLTFKIVGLIIYIYWGIYFFRFANTLPKKIVSFCIALLSVSYVVMVALTRDPYIGLIYNF